MPNSKTLLLFPTNFELQKVTAQIERLQSTCDISIAVCGFGVIESGLGAMAELFKRMSEEPDRVILCGVAGSLDSRLVTGQAYQFRRVGCYGLGVGNHELFQSAHELGWLQGEPFIELQVSENPKNEETQDLLLTVCAASANAEEARSKLNKFPGALAEEMEGYSVAVACQRLGLPLHIVRGISNRAGDRNHTNWLLDQAMASVMHIIKRVIAA